MIAGNAILKPAGHYNRLSTLLEMSLSQSNNLMLLRSTFYF